MCKYNTLIYTYNSITSNNNPLTIKYKWHLLSIMLKTQMLTIGFNTIKKNVNRLLSLLRCLYNINHISSEIEGERSQRINKNRFRLTENCIVRLTERKTRSEQVGIDYYSDKFWIKIKKRWTSLAQFFFLFFEKALSNILRREGNVLFKQVKKYTHYPFISNPIASRSSHQEIAFEEAQPNLISPVQNFLKKP